MKAILLPTDFSNNAMNAAFYAIHLFRQETCRFVFLHSYEVNGYFRKSQLVPIPGEEIRIKAREQAERQLQEMVQAVTEQFSQMNHEFVVVAKNDLLVTAINEELLNSSYEVVVIGTQGSSETQEAGFGSNTIRILEEVKNYPVLAIPSNTSYAPLKEVVLATGFKIKPVPEEFNFLKYLILKFNAGLKILHIDEGGLNEWQNKNKETLEKILKDVPHSFHVLSHVTIPVGIYCFTESRGSNMIAFVNKKHSFLANLLLDPLYKNIGHYSTIPLLVMNYSST